MFELDGYSDDNPGAQALDTRRTAWLQARGFRVIRFTNAEVFRNLEGVLLTIDLALQGPHPGPLPQPGEGVVE